MIIGAFASGSLVLAFLRLLEGRDGRIAYSVDGAYVRDVSVQHDLVHRVMGW